MLPAKNGLRFYQDHDPASVNDRRKINLWPFLCSPYVLSPNPESKAAVVLAFSLIYYSYGILIQALLGIWCWQKMKLEIFT